MLLFFVFSLNMNFYRGEQIHLHMHSSTSWWSIKFSFVYFLNQGGGFKVQLISLKMSEMFGSIRKIYEIALLSVRQWGHLKIYITREEIVLALMTGKIYRATQKLDTSLLFFLMGSCNPASPSTHWVKNAILSIIFAAKYLCMLLNLWTPLT